MIVEGRTFGLLMAIVAAILALYFFNESQKGKVRQIRRVPGLDALDEAINRSVEMGRPVLASTSYDSLATAHTMAVMSGISLIRYSAVETAKKGIPLLLPIGPPDVLALVDENYREATIEAGAPEMYNPENVVYLTTQQWAYTSGVMDMIQDYRPGACIFVSRFHAEILHIGLAARRVGSVMIGGTPHWGMSAFFAVTADYTLLGDEIYAAAGYASKDNAMISFLSAQDVMKWIAGALILLGSLLATVGTDIVTQILGM
jgi:hypothetical protein